MKTQNILTIFFLFSLTFSFASVLKSKLRTQWSKWWRVQTTNGKVNIYPSVADCNKNCKFSSIDCLKITKWADQGAILNELTGAKKYVNEAICYYDTPPVYKTNEVKKIGNFKYGFLESDICHSFCQSLFSKLCSKKDGKHFCN